MPVYPPQDRLIRKEVALGAIRELTPPEDHIGVSLIAPMMDVASDDVIFDYTRQLAEGLAPARAEDAESELAQKDLMLGGQGRASIMDWALKDHYTASDVQRYREALLIQAQLQGMDVAISGLPLTVGTQLADFQNKIARDDASRRAKLDNRLEWLIMTALDTGGISYNDGKITFSVNYGRPSAQQDQAPAGGLYNTTNSDPIGDALKIQEYMWDKYAVRMTRVVGSHKVVRNLLNSERFMAAGMINRGVQPGTSGNTDLHYLTGGWGPEIAKAIYEQNTSMKIIEYDSVYRTRAVGSQTIINNRFLSDKKLYFLPDEQDVAKLDDAIGFAKTLTSPHPEGNWSSGYYEYEQETRDPWGVDRGTGIKAFPIMMHLDWTYTMQVLP